MLHVEPKLNTKCLLCNRPFSKKRKGKFCPSPSYCRYDNNLRLKNPKIIKLVEEKDNNFFYLLGLIASDGHLHSKAYGVEITVNTKDVQVLFEIQNIYGGAITNKKDNTTIWRISYKPFYDYLLSIGITTLKSLDLNIENFFATLTLEQKKNFVRGVIDGDGGVRVYQYFSNYTQRAECNLHFDVCSGSEVFLQTIANFINKEFEDNKVNVKFEPKAKAFYIKANGGLKPVRILEFIYSSYSKNNIGMHRKYYTFLNFKHFLDNNRASQLYDKESRGRLTLFDSEKFIPKNLKRLKIVGTMTNSFYDKPQFN